MIDDPYAEYDAAESPGVNKRGLLWPPRPDPGVLAPLSYAQREQRFGHIAFVRRPLKDNPENIVITNGWQKEHLKSVFVPEMQELAGLNQGKGWPVSGKVLVHKIAADSLVGLFAAWKEAGLIGLLRTFGGCWAPRMSRGSDSVLSNHSYATAIDINVAWNMLKRVPALVGAEGSVRELIPIAVEYKWWWGGWGWPPDYARLDGMHLEYVG